MLSSGPGKQNRFKTRNYESAWRPKFFYLLHGRKLLAGQCRTELHTLLQASLRAACGALSEIHVLWSLMYCDLRLWRAHWCCANSRGFNKLSKACLPHAASCSSRLIADLHNSHLKWLGHKQHIRLNAVQKLSTNTCCIREIVREVSMHATYSPTMHTCNMHLCKEPCQDMLFHFQHEAGCKLLLAAVLRFT